jgi:hypothetical protein
MEQHEYVRRLLEAYRATPGTCGAVRRPDRLLAIQLHERSGSPALAGCVANRYRRAPGNGNHHRREVRQRADDPERRSIGGARQAPRGGECQRVFDRFEASPRRP